MHREFRGHDAQDEGMTTTPVQASDAFLYPPLRPVRHINGPKESYFRSIIRTSTFLMPTVTRRAVLPRGVYGCASTPSRSRSERSQQAAIGDASSVQQT